MDHQKAVRERTVADREYRNAYIQAYNDYAKKPQKDEDSDAQTDRLHQSGCPKTALFTAHRDNKARRFIKRATRRYKAAGVIFPFEPLDGEMLVEMDYEEEKKKDDEA